ncbi:MAG: Antitoxin-like ribbon-helix-helix [Acetobacteraceae bacterium]|jgi:hypothetical protein|nr:Antitoxin-like ribbon-helix-helix [Acetobacteraceae bacterium]
MTKKPTGLAAAVSKKAAAAASSPPEPTASSGTLRTLTLRLPEMVHDQLREMAFTSRRSQHSLLMEGLNMLFERHGKPPIAPQTA